MDNDIKIDRDYTLKIYKLYLAKRSNSSFFGRLYI